MTSLKKKYYYFNMKKPNRFLTYFALGTALVGLLLFSCKNNKNSTHETVNVDFFTNKHYQYTTVGDALKMAYLDIGNSNAPVILLLHGEPNSSFIYRNIAPELVKQHFRVIIPDLVGFGYSDKPKNAELITYSNQTKWLNNFIHSLKLKNIHLFAHDWGGMIGLRIVATQPHLFSKVAVSYSYLFEGVEQIPESFIGFVNYAKKEPSFSAGNIMDWGTNIKLSDSIKAMYDKPFQSKTDYNSVKKFPSMIPIHKNDPAAILNTAFNKKLKEFTKPFITIWGNHTDLMWQGKDSILQKNIAGAKNQTHYTLASNHFIQEDKPAALTQILIDFFSNKN